MYAAPRLFCQLLLYLLLALPTTLLAQQTTLTGTVVDASSGRPIPFATVELPTRQVGVQATETGTFTLAMPASLASADSLRVASLGFATRMMALPGTGAAPVRLELRALPVSLAEVVVQGSRAPLVRLGPTENPTGRSGFGGGELRATGSKGWQIARRFDGGATGFLQAVRFYVKPNQSCGKLTGQAPFRVRVYVADGPNGAPGTDLLTTSVVTAAIKTGWHEIDLTQHQITTTSAGFYVAMEWLYTSAEFGCERSYPIPRSKARKTSYSYGQSLSGYISAAPNTTWYLSAGHQWQQIRPFAIKIGNANVGDNLNAAIQAIIQPD